MPSGASAFAVVCAAAAACGGTFSDDEAWRGMSAGRVRVGVAANALEGPTRHGVEGGNKKVLIVLKQVDYHTVGLSIPVGQKVRKRSVTRPSPARSCGQYRNNMRRVKPSSSMEHGDILETKHLG